jgi:hypothetical protein
MVIGPSAGEAEESIASGPVGIGVGIEVGEDVRFTGSVRQLEAPLQPEDLGHGPEQLVDGLEAEEGEHARHFIVGVRYVGAHDLLVLSG